ncbi:MAG: imidazole glycerol phosphate synthase subunit HisH [Myxococcaceae bacterium]
MKAALFDYGAGNLHSLGKALAQAGAEVRVEPDILRALDTDLFVLPGVGAFGPAAQRLAGGLAQVRQALGRGLPCLGVCLGMQLLFESSEEGAGEGVGHFRGRVTALRAKQVPHIGWNDVASEAAVFEKSRFRWAYYANGFACRAEDPGDVVAWSTHENDRFPAAVRKGNVFGVQFHPEKSSAAGLRVLQALLEEVRR